MGSAVDRWFAHGQASFPEISWDWTQFRAVAQAREGRWPSTVHDSDAALVCACLCRAPGAIERFELTHQVLLRRLEHKVASAGVDPAELRQQLRVRLFVGTHVEPLVLQFEGRGPLGAWVRVVATRLALELIEQKARGPASMTSLEWVQRAASSDLEVQAARNELRDVFQTALRTAMETLPSGERAVLRQYYAHGVGVDGLAKLLGVHRSNASRAVARARQTLLRSVRSHLQSELRLTDSSLDDVVRLMRSDLGLSLSQLFASSS